jgi:hypothetical protein
MNKKESREVTRVQIHHLYTQTLKYAAAEKKLFSQISSVWTRYRKPLLHNRGLPEEREKLVINLEKAVNELLHQFHLMHHVVVRVGQKQNINADFPFTIEYDYSIDDIPYSDPRESGTKNPLRTLVFDLSSGLEIQLKSAKKYLKDEREISFGVYNNGEITLEISQPRTNLKAIYRRLTFLVDKDTSRKTYDQLATEYHLSAETLKSMYNAASKLLNSGEIYRLFSPFPPGIQPKFKITL